MSKYSHPRRRDARPGAGSGRDCSSCRHRSCGDGPRSSLRRSVRDLPRRAARGLGMDCDDEHPGGPRRAAHDRARRGDRGRRPRPGATSAPTLRSSRSRPSSSTRSSGSARRWTSPRAGCSRPTRSPPRSCPDAEQLGRRGRAHPGPGTGPRSPVRRPGAGRRDACAGRGAARRARRCSATPRSSVSTSPRRPGRPSSTCSSRMPTPPCWPRVSPPATSLSSWTRGSADGCHRARLRFRLARGHHDGALGMALLWPRPVLLVEADPTGGSGLLAGYFRGTREYVGGLIELALTSSRPQRRAGRGRPSHRGHQRLVRRRHSVAHPGQCPAGSLGCRSPRSSADLESTGQDVIVDAGRLGLVGSPGAAARRTPT